MNTISNEDRSRRYLNPYFGGFLLGLVLLATMFITGRGLGASGAVKSTVVQAVHTVSPAHVQKSKYYSQFISDDIHPMSNWLVFEVIGILAGAFISGVLARRIKLKIEHSPKISSRTRLIMALLGGLMFGLGSQFGRGCTSGAALSGMASMATSGFIAMMAIFGSAYMFAYFFRKFWI
jgi:uncharacterized protein